MKPIEWATLTPREASRLLGAAVRNERAVGLRFERGEASEAEFRAAMQIEEDLRVFILAGARPGKDGRQAETP